LAKLRRPRYHADGYFILSEEMLDGLIEHGLLDPRERYNMNAAQDGLVKFLAQFLCKQKHAASQGIGTEAVN
jgi:hypothetical protein